MAHSRESLWSSYIPRALALGLALLVLIPAVAMARGGLTSDVRLPDVRRLRTADAKRRIEQAGFKVGTVYEVSRERILAAYRVRYPIGYVFMQAPTFEDASGMPIRKPLGTTIHIIVAATRDGSVLPPVPALREATLPRPAPPAQPVPRQPPPTQSRPAQPRRERPVPAQPAPPPLEDNRVPPPAPPVAPQVEVPRRPAPKSPPPSHAEVPGDAEMPVDTSPAPRIAAGSPDAPRVAPKADPNKVPSLTGLELAEAEQLARDADMKLYVERVGGHPIGRVLEQIPAAGSKRPAGAVVKVIVTAGGDFDGDAMPSAPEVYLAAIEVPGLLDRTVLQARRILGDLGLLIREEKAKRGLPGLVVDQKPAAGAKVPKGGVVRVWIAPENAKATNANAKTDAGKPPPPGPLNTGDTLRKDAPAQPAVPGPKPPLTPGPLAGGIPKPVSPGVNTQLPKEASVPVGFTWRGVKGASAYILEIEEEGAEGRWIANARKPSRTTAVLLEVERLDTSMTKRLRWRVRAVINGREGKPSVWVLLR